MKHTIGSHRKLYKMLHDCGLYELRHDLVNDYSNGRTTNSAELTQQEINALIERLQVIQMNMGIPNDFQMGARMRKRILSLFHQYGHTTYCPIRKKMIVDFDLLDNWMLKYSYLHKKLNSYKYKELPKLVSQVEILLEKYLEAVQ